MGICSCLSPSPQLKTWWLTLTWRISRQIWMNHLLWIGRLFVVLLVETGASLLARDNSAHLHALQGAASFEPALHCLAKISRHPPAHLQHLQVLQGVQSAVASSMSNSCRWKVRKTTL